LHQKAEPYGTQIVYITDGCVVALTVKVSNPKDRNAGCNGLSTAITAYLL
jgi:hypothetical protein